MPLRCFIYENSQKHNDGKGDKYMNSDSHNFYLSIDDVLIKYSDMVLKIAVTHTKCYEDAQDVFQDVFLNYIRKKHCFKDENHLKATLIRTTINLCKNIFTSAWYRHTTALPECLINDTMDDESMELYFAIHELPMKYRTIIHLHYYEDMSIAEMSNLLGIKVSTIKSQLSRGRSLLKQNLKGVQQNETRI